MESVVSRRIAFCADDVALVGGVGEAVVLLAGAGRLSSASCVTNAPAWRAEGAAIATATKAFAGFELGLHFNLTEGVPLSPDLAAVWPALPSLGELIVGAHLGTLPIAALAIEWRAQIDAFAEVVGRLPGHVDGHQHVHHLPRIRDIVMEWVDELDNGARPAIRNTGRVLGPGHAFKRWVIEGTGGRALERALRERSLRRNAALLGVYDFRDADYRRLTRGWLAAAPAHGGLVFCHPRHGPASGADAIGSARGREAAYLASDEFEADLAEAGLSVTPTWQSSSAD